MNRSAASQDMARVGVQATQASNFSISGLRKHGISRRRASLLATPNEIGHGLQGQFFIFAGVQTRGLDGFGAFPER